MSTIDPNTITLGDLVAREPRAAALFEQIGVDYCCGGDRTVADAVAQRGLDPTTVAVLINNLAQQADGPSGDAHDVAHSSMGELCDHIVAAHHDLLRRELPAIGEQAATVVRVHGAGHPELGDLQRVFDGMRRELEAHIEIEESKLFPACRRLERSRSPESELTPGLLALLEDDHSEVGGALVVLRELCGDYDESKALCGTHRRLLRALRDLERDLHRHIHEENNVLFGKIRARVGTAA